MNYRLKPAYLLYGFIIVMPVIFFVLLAMYRDAVWTVYLWQRTIDEERLHGGAWVVRKAYPWNQATESTGSTIGGLPGKFYHLYTCDEKAAYLKSLLTPVGGPLVAMPGGKAPQMTRQIVDPDTFQVTFEYSADSDHSAPWATRTTWQVACGRQAPDSWFRWIPAGFVSRRR
ncbi:MAG: hypothetical protein WAP47_12010 [Candidatus Rokuibacteriota bacterium]